MTAELRAPLVAWRDAPSEATEAEARAALVAAGMIEGTEPLEAADAALWLEVIEGAPLPVVAQAVLAQAGEVEVDRGFDPVSVRLADALASAVAEAAGPVDVRARVQAEVEGVGLPEGWLAGLLDHTLPAEVHARAAAQVATDPRLGHELGLHAEVARRLRNAVTDQAGATPDVWRAIAPEIGFADPEGVPGWNPELLREAVRSEAGEIHIAQAVVAQLRREAQAPIPDEPPAMNRGWIAAAVLLLAAAAAALMVVPSWFVPVESDDLFVQRPISFATGGEINLDEVRYGEKASVYVDLPPTAEGSVIIWVDDGAEL